MTNPKSGVNLEQSDLMCASGRDHIQCCEVYSRLCFVQKEQVTLEKFASFDTLCLQHRHCTKRWVRWSSKGVFTELTVNQQRGRLGWFLYRACHRLGSFLAFPTTYCTGFVFFSPLLGLAMEPRVSEASSASLIRGNMFVCTTLALSAAKPRACHS